MVSTLVCAKVMVRIGWEWGALLQRIEFKGWEKEVEGREDFDLNYKNHDSI